MEKRQDTYGPNALPEEHEFQIVGAVFRQLKGPLSLVLVVAGLATVGLGEFLDAIVIFAALASMTCLSLWI